MSWTSPAEPRGAEKRKSRRKKEGAFYTPAFITRYIIEQALGGVLRDRFEQLRQAHQEAAKGAARAVLADPRVYALDKLKKPERAALVRFWEAWQDELAAIRLLDPACGSGAFLIEAFDQLHAAYQASNDRLQELRGHRTLFDLDKRILENNLYGVDLNEEAIEICRLSLWIKTAERGKALTSLDHTIRVGNSIVADPAVHPKAFDWQAAFPEVFEKGGFDVVVANPPYVRQELLSPIKPYLESAYRAYHGMADLYVYFYELGIRLLKPGGLLSFIVTNKWMKSATASRCGGSLPRTPGLSRWSTSGTPSRFSRRRTYFRRSSWPAARPNAPKPATARLCTIPREQLRIDDLSRQIEREGVELPLSQLGADAWQLEPTGVSTLFAKIKAAGVPLAEFAGVKPYRGVVTGCNDAFLIDTATRNALVSKTRSARKSLNLTFAARTLTDGSPLGRAMDGRSPDVGSRLRNTLRLCRHLERYRRQLEPKPKDWQGDECAGRKSEGRTSGGNSRPYRILGWSLTSPRSSIRKSSFTRPMPWTRPGNTATTRRSSSPRPTRTCWPFSIRPLPGGTTGATCPT